MSGLFYVCATIPLMIFVALIVLGLCFGSFVNALVWRLHEQDELSAKLEALKSQKSTKAISAKIAKLQSQLPNLSISRGRSMCPDCQHSLAWYDLLPVVSWLSVGGRCRYCRKPISWQYPLVELTTVALYVISYRYWPEPLTGQGAFDFAIWLAVLTAFMALVIYDSRWMILPNKIIYPLLGLAVGQRIIDTVVFEAGWLALASSLAGALIGGGIFYLLFQVSNGKWIGGGDVKLGFALGLLVGDPMQAALVLFVASLLGLLGSVPALLSGKLRRDLQIPFGPFLMAGCFIVVLFGQSVVAWYMRFLIPLS